MKNAGHALPVILLLFAASSCAPTTQWTAAPGASYGAFSNPQRVTIQGYVGEAMEPFLTRSGRYLLFNNSNDPKVDTNLHFAERVDDLNFVYRGEVGGVNTPALEGVPSVDQQGNFYFVSTRSYKETFSTLYHGKWRNGHVTSVDLVSGVSKKQLGALNFDAEISADGNTLYFVDGLFTGGSVPKAGDIGIAVRDGAGFRRQMGSAEMFRHINTDQLEYAPATSLDQLELFFTRLDVGRKHIGIYRAVRANASDPFQPPQRIGAIDGFVEAPTLSANGRLLYYHKKEDGRHVIYRISR